MAQRYRVLGRRPTGRGEETVHDFWSAAGSAENYQKFGTLAPPAALDVGQKSCTLCPKKGKKTIFGPNEPKPKKIPNP